MTIYTGISMMIFRPDITSELCEREPLWLYVLQMVLGETLPLKEVSVEFALGGTRW
jgi:hypothetical protein